MLTAKAQYNLRNARQYFEEHLSVGDYYDEGQKTCGDWLGQGAEKLGLSGRVAAEDFLALCENKHPQTGKRLTPRLKLFRSDGETVTANRRIFYDFTFSPPKSVSIAALVGEDQRIVEAHHRAVNVAVREFERFAATRVRRNAANSSRMTGNIVAARFTHETSRSLDPHLHTHVIVFNATFDEQEERWKALQNYEMLRARKFIENLYYHELAKDLQRFGYSIYNRPRGDFQIEGVSEELCDRFSKRHQQINEALDELLVRKPELAGANAKDLREHLAAAERSRKIRDLSSSQLKALWDAQISAEDKRSLGSLTKPSAAESVQSEDQVAREAIAWAEEHLFDRRSVVLEAEIWECALERARGKQVSLDTLKHLTGERDYVRNPAIPFQVTTKPVLQREWEIVATAAQGVGQCRSFARGDGDVDGFLGTDGTTLVRLEQREALSRLEQKEAFLRLIRSRDFISLFRGGAGTGKTHLLQKLVSFLEDNEWPVAVIAPQRQQVVGLKAADFPSPTTVADYLTRRPNRDNLVVVVDEAGQIGARQMLELVRLVKSLNGRLILSGDTRQHGPVEASDALLAIERFAGLDPAELRSIRRQNPDLGQTKDERASIAAYRRAVEAAAAGRLQESFDRLDRMGAVIAGRFDEQADKLAGEYLRLTEQACSTVVVSQTWGEVHRVNQQVRAVLKSKGILDGEERIVPALEKVDLTSAQKRDPRFYDPATVIVFNQPLRGVAAGSTGRPAAFLGNRLLVEVGQRIVRLPARHLDRINVCRPVELPLSPGDRLQLKANRKQSDGASVTNGELVTVRSLSPDGVIELQDGRVLDANYREFVPGYAVTSYGSQGRTVDYVLFSDQRSRLRPTTSNGTLQFREAEREFASSRRTKSSCAKTSSGQAKGSSRWKSSAR